MALFYGLRISAFYFLRQISSVFRLYPSRNLALVRHSSWIYLSAFVSTSCSSYFVPADIVSRFLSVLCFSEVFFLSSAVCLYGLRLVGVKDVMCDANRRKRRCVELLCSLKNDNPELLWSWRRPPSGFCRAEQSKHTSHWNWKKVHFEQPHRETGLQCEGAKEFHPPPTAVKHFMLAR